MSIKYDSAYAKLIETLHTICLEGDEVVRATCSESQIKKLISIGYVTYIGGYPYPTQLGKEISRAHRVVK